MPLACATPVTTTGTFASMTALLPISPCMFAPQHVTVWFASRAQLWLSPSAISTAVAMPVTATGNELSIVELLPSWPLPFSPQHTTVPSARSAHECAAPAAIWVTLLSEPAPPTPTTWTAPSRSVVELSPSWPLVLRTQQNTRLTPVVLLAVV